MRNRQGYFDNGKMRECTCCGELFPKTSNMTLCKPCNSSRVKSQTPEWKMHQRAKQRCKFTGHEFNIEIEDVIIPDMCPILNIPLNMNSGKPGAYKNSPSLDRIDNTKGYVKGNIQVISQLANSMKGAATVEELHKFADWINSHYPRQNLTNSVEHN
jgi:hypothetical protein